MTGSARIIRGNALALPLADNSVDAVITSPPYFGLRSYQDQGSHYLGQIGSEPTPVEFIDALIAATREMVRVLKPSGSIFVNLGDKYAGGGGGNYGDGKSVKGREGAHTTNIHNRPAWLEAAGMRAKSLMLLPERYRIACVDQLGLIARAVIVWAKPNGLPESVTDRVRRSHEDWVHLTVQPRYYSAVDEIREDFGPRHINGMTYQQRAAEGFEGEEPDRATRGNQRYDRRAGDNTKAGNPLGKLPGSVWSIPTQPLTVPPELGVDHFAAFPMEWPRRIIQGWSPAGVCTVCGEGRRPVVARDKRPLQATYNGTLTRVPGVGREDYRTGVPSITDATITGYACACPEPTAPTQPSLILDPFSGTGTTVLVAKMLGRNGIGVDMSSDYCRLAAWRTTDPAQMAAAAQVERPETVPDGQLSLFEEMLT